MKFFACVWYQVPGICFGCGNVVVIGSPSEHRTNTQKSTLALTKAAALSAPATIVPLLLDCVLLRLRGCFRNSE